MWESDGGNVDPSGYKRLCHRCCLNGAEIYRFTLKRNRTKQGWYWNIRTEKGDIHTEWVVNAAGCGAEKLEEWLMLIYPYSQLNTNIL